MPVEFLAPQHEVWHPPGGELRMAKFYVHKTSSKSARHNEIHRQKRRWLEHMERAEHMVPSADAQLIVDGPWTEPVRSKTDGGLEIALDLDCYFMVCWFDRTKPLVLSAEDAELHRQTADAQRQRPLLRRLLGRFTNMTEAELETKAKGIVKSIEDGRKERELREKLRRQRK